jgi:hypothetical protein
VAASQRAPIGKSVPDTSIKDQTSALLAAPVSRPTGLFAKSFNFSFGLKLGELGHSLSERASSLLLAILNLVPFKPDAPYSFELLKHYAEGSGSPYQIKSVPEQWQTWIVKATHAKPGEHKSLDPYNSGIYDLTNSLGHFDVTVTNNREGGKVFQISKFYEFSFKKNDREQKGRHGFPLGDLNEITLELVRVLLPSKEYRNPGGFTEHWEVKKIGKRTFLLIPQQFLSEEGTPFSVKGEFIYYPDRKH